MGAEELAWGTGVPRVGDLICSKYTITGVLGHGGMGAVFRAVHSVTGKSFALKWLLPQAAVSTDGRRRLIREARAASRLKHPAIVEIYDVEESQGALFLVMEFLEGETLQELLAREGRLHPALACDLLLPCMRGMARAHAVGIVHRDLKPANVFLCAATDDTPRFAKILDFGISRVTDEASTEWQVTQSGAIVGTPHYMAAEQLQGRPPDPRSDVYAFGVLLYEAVSGRRPFLGNALPELVFNITLQPLTSLHDLRPDLPPAFVAAVHRALERDLERRFPSMTALVAALEAARPEFESGRGRRARVRGARSRAQLQNQAGADERSRWAVWLTGLAALLALGFAGRAWMTTHRTPNVPDAPRTSASALSVPTQTHAAASVSNSAPSAEAPNAARGETVGSKPHANEQAAVPVAPAVPPTAVRPSPAAPKSEARQQASHVDKRRQASTPSRRSATPPSVPREIEAEEDELAPKEHELAPKKHGPAPEEDELAPTETPVRALGSKLDISEF